LADVSFKSPLFSFAQNRGKFALYRLQPTTIPPAPQSGTQGQTGRKKRRTFWLAYSCVFLFYFSHLAKLPLTDICSKHLLFTFAQNRGKFVPNCLALQLLHLLCKAAHKGKQGVKKGKPFNGSPCHVVFCSMCFHSLLIKTTPNPIIFSKSFALWQNTFPLPNSLSKTKFVL
jgi:hypothetical protein